MQGPVLVPDSTHCRGSWGLRPTLFPEGSKPCHAHHLYFAVLNLARWRRSANHGDCGDGFLHTSAHQPTRMLSEVKEERWSMPPGETS
eukprot:338041-Amphidinium_carterae.1